MGDIRPVGASRGFRQNQLQPLLLAELNHLFQIEQRFLLEELFPRLLIRKIIRNPYLLIRSIINDLFRSEIIASYAGVHIIVQDLKVRGVQLLPPGMIGNNWKKIGKKIIQGIRTRLDGLQLVSGKAHFHESLLIIGLIRNAPQHGDIQHHSLQRIGMVLVSLSQPIVGGQHGLLLCGKIPGTDPIILIQLHRRKAINGDTGPQKNRLNGILRLLIKAVNRIVIIPFQPNRLKQKVYSPKQKN